MTKYQRERIKDAVNEAGEKIDAEADKFVDKGQGLMGKLKDSKWTAAGLLGGALALAALLLK